MADNVIKSSDVNSAESKTVKKAPAKKAAPKKSAAKNTVSENTTAEPVVDKTVNSDSMVIVFETGSSYTSNGIRFTKDNRIQEIPSEDAKRLLSLDNFRLPNPFELEDYLNSKED